MVEANERPQILPILWPAAAERQPELTQRPQILLMLWPAAAERQPTRYLAYSEKENWHKDSGGQNQA